MMDELWREEEKKTLESIAKLTELGKVKWECVEYNPLCFMNEDKVDETSAYLCQMFTLTAEIGGMPYELEIAEYITVPDGKGDIALTLTRDVPDDFMKIDSILSSDVDEYENCEPSEIGKRYKNDPAMRLTETIVPVVIESEAVQDTFEWASSSMKTELQMRFLIIQWFGLPKSCLINIAFSTTTGFFSTSLIGKN